MYEKLMLLFQNLLENNLFQGVASLFSIFGFLITCWTLWTVKNLYKKSVFKGRIEDHQKKLSYLASSLAAQLNSYDDNVSDIQLVCAELYPVIRGVKKNAPKPLSKDVHNLEKKILSCRRKWKLGLNCFAPSAKDVRGIYNELRLILSEIDTTTKDMYWEQ